MGTVDKTKSLSEIKVIPAGGPQTTLSGKRSITIDFRDNGFAIRTFRDGRPDEMYPAYPLAEAEIIIQATLRGLEPLPFLNDRGKQFD